MVSAVLKTETQSSEGSRQTTVALEVILSLVFVGKYISLLPFDKAELHRVRTSCPGLLHGVAAPQPPEDESRRVQTV